MASNNNDLFDEMGWIKVFRKLKYSSVFANERTLKLFLWCLLTAEYRKVTRPVDLNIYGAQMEVNLEPGQFVFSAGKCAEETGIAKSTIQRHIKKLQKEHKVISVKAGRKFSVITILNFSKFQEKKTDKRVTHGSLAGHSRVTHGSLTGRSIYKEEEYKEYKESKEEREKLFFDFENDFTDHQKKMLKDCFKLMAHLWVDLTGPANQRKIARSKIYGYLNTWPRNNAGIAQKRKHLRTYVARKSNGERAHSLDSFIKNNVLANEADK